VIRYPCIQNITLSMIKASIVTLWTRGGMVTQPKLCEQRYPKVAGIVRCLLNHKPEALSIDCCDLEGKFEFLVALLAENNLLKRLTRTTRIQNTDTATLENGQKTVEIKAYDEIITRRCDDFD
jgi:hypothetical protein